MNGSSITLSHLKYYQSMMIQINSCKFPTLSNSSMQQIPLSARTRAPPSSAKSPVSFISRIVTTIWRGLSESNFLPYLERQLLLNQHRNYPCQLCKHLWELKRQCASEADSWRLQDHPSNIYLCLL